MYLDVEITKRERRNHDPFDFMPPKIPKGSRVMVFWDSYRNKKSIERNAAIRLLKETLKKLEG